MTERKLCPKCNGRGEYFFDDHCQGTWVECDMCKGFGVYPLTNEEWIQAATTEQLADAFFDYRYVYANPKQKLWMSASEKCIKTDIVEWLKQPHKEE